MVVLGQVAVQVVGVGRRTGGKFETFGGIACVGDVGEAVGTGGVTVSVGEIVYDIETQVWHLPSPVVGLDVAVLISLNQEYRNRNRQDTYSLFLMNNLNKCLHICKFLFPLLYRMKYSSLVNFQ